MARNFTRMTIDDALHYPADARERIVKGYPAHVRRARAMGLPAIGEGAVYPIEDEFLKVPAFEVPRHWLEIAGLDFGWDHPTAAARIAIDPDSQTFYLVDTYRKRKETPLYHCEKLKAWGKHLPFAWGLEGKQTRLDDNPEQQWRKFEKHGLRMLSEHATFETGGVGVEQGVQEILELMQTGRFKAFAHLVDFFEEKNSYHRFKRDEDKVAQIKKVHDDILDAIRYAIMMRRHAVPVAWRPMYGGRPKPIARRRPDSRDL